jgi:hypothetical protein
MQNTLAYLPMGSSDPEANSVFNVVIAYEDFETGKQAKRTYDFLVKNLGQGCEFSNQMWKFDVLGIPKLREMAVQDAIAADIIIVSSRGGNELPMKVRIWMESWVSQQPRALALVALFEAESNPVQPIRDYLAAIAKQGQMEFFAQPDYLAGDHALEESIPFPLGKQDSNRTFSILAGAMQRGPDLPRWGINE